MVKLSKNIITGWIFIIYLKYIYPFILNFYNVKIINKDKLINKDKNKPNIFISRHSTHNFDILIGLITLYRYNNKLVRGCGHFLVKYLYPHYINLGIFVGTKENAQYLLDNNEDIFIMPGGAEEMTIGSNNSNKLYWYSKSRKIKSGFAKLAIKNNINIIPICCKNVENMTFSPFVYIANKIYIIKLYDDLLNNTNGIIYKYLFFFKILISTIFNNFLTIPIPCTIEIIIGDEIKLNDNDDVLEYTIKCKKILQKMYDINTL